MFLLRCFLPGLLLLWPGQCRPQNAARLLERGWQSLVQDNDTEAMRYFGSAYLDAWQRGDTLHTAQALLYLGFCSYSTSSSRGMDYCHKAMQEYRKLEKTAPLKALEGRSRCLQLISTIQGRLGHYDAVTSYSMEALKGFPPGADTTGTVGLIYNSLGTAHAASGRPDSAAWYYRQALAEHLRTNNTTYLPGAMAKIADLEMTAGQQPAAAARYARAWAIADSTGNRQAQVLVLLGMGKWAKSVDRGRRDALSYYRQAGRIATTLTDKAFSLRVAEQLLDYYTRAGDYRSALACKDTISRLRDSMYSFDRQKELKAMEIQSGIAEKERLLALAQKDRQITQLVNYLLWGGLGLLALAAGAVILVLRRNHNRDRLLLQTKEALIRSNAAQQRMEEEQQRLKEQQLQQQIEFRESQLSAMTLQMAQKNELMQELKNRLSEEKVYEKDHKLQKLLARGMTQNKEWTDFNAYFESINQHFYARLKQTYPGIGPNDLKICALIKLNLSIKEMAAILNISPDSVKTARYRLRKKLQLNTEDNLTDFIMTL